MAWTPQRQVIDVSPAKDALLSFIEANNTDALDWANNGPGLAPFAAVYPNASSRLRTLFPSIALIAWGFGNTDESDEAADAILSLRFEVEITGTADTLPGLVEKYDLAVRSMLVNAPLMSNLTQGSKSVTHMWAPDDPATTFDVLRGFKNADFLQRFQTEIDYKLMTNLI